MWQRFTLYDVRVIGHYLGVLILFSSFALLAPLLTAVVMGEWEPASRYLLTIGVSLLVGSGLRFLRIEPGRLNRQQALAVTGLAWIVVALIAAIPLALSGHYAHYLDALFESVSGLTTTGASIVQDLNHLSYADNMWRFAMHFVGGMGLIVVAMSLGLFGKRAGASLYSSEGRSEHVVPNLIQTTQMIAKTTVFIILIMTGILTVICVFIGIEPVRAVLQSFWLAISGFTTGGFTPMTNSVMYYHSLGMEIVLMVLMMLGTFNFILYSEIRKGRTLAFFRDLEIRTMVIWLSVMTLVLAAALTASTSFADLGAMIRRGLFTVISAFSTTGYLNITGNELTSAFSSGAFLSIAVIMAVGGSSGSTSGGIKFWRVGIIAKSIIATIKETLAPDTARVAVDYTHVGRRLLSPEIVREAMTVFILFVITYAIGSLAGIAHGYEATQSIFESVSMASNSGITCGIVAPGMPMTLETVYVIQMWAGRLEFVTLLALVVEIIVTVVPYRQITKRRG